MAYGGNIFRRSGDRVNSDHSVCPVCGVHLEMGRDVSSDAGAARALPIKVMVSQSLGPREMLIASDGRGVRFVNLGEIE